jgi:NADP-dependent 3-hydroxy acid dehydrogenase YdfG
MSEFQNAHALVTGAASGAGAASSRLLAARGAAKLTLMDRDAPRLEELAFSLPGGTSLLVGDVADEALWAGAGLAGLTHAVANAGVGVSDGGYSL